MPTESSCPKCNLKYDFEHPDWDDVEALSQIAMDLEADLERVDDRIAELNAQDEAYDFGDY